MPTLGQALDDATRRLRAAGSETARLDAEVLLAFAIGTDRTGVLAHPDLELQASHAERLESAVVRREAGEPVAYIRGIKEFYGIVLGVDPRVLIPRPESELLVEIGLARLRERLSGTPRPAGTPRLRAVDIATGSGAVAIALAVSLRRRGQLDEVDILATDISSDALQVAMENAVGHGVADRMRFREGDLLPGGELPFDLVLANLPYVPSGDVPGLPVAARFEPRLALDGGPDGLVQVRRLIAALPAALADGGSALLEIDPRQVEAVHADVVEVAPSWEVLVHPDLSGHPRAVEIRAAADAGHGTGPDAASGAAAGSDAGELTGAGDPRIGGPL